MKNSFVTKGFVCLFLAATAAVALEEEEDPFDSRLKTLSEEFNAIEGLDEEPEAAQEPLEAPRR